MRHLPKCRLSRQTFLSQAVCQMCPSPTSCPLLLQLMVRCLIAQPVPAAPQDLAVFVHSLRGEFCRVLDPWGQIPSSTASTTPGTSLARPSCDLLLPEPAQLPACPCSEQLLLPSSSTALPTCARCVQPNPLYPSSLLLRFGMRPNLCFAAWHPEELFAAGALVPEIPAAGPDDAPWLLCAPCHAKPSIHSLVPGDSDVQRQPRVSAVPSSTDRHARERREAQPDTPDGRRVYF